jgi:hypothetical protein
MIGFADAKENCPFGHALADEAAFAGILGLRLRAGDGQGRKRDGSGDGHGLLAIDRCMADCTK